VVGLQQAAIRVEREMVASSSAVAQKALMLLYESFGVNAGEWQQAL
jgi:hypothetical protein